MGPVLDALLKELEAAARDLSTHAAEESERRARTLATLSRVAESLSGLLRERRAETEEQVSERSAQESAARQREADVWREIEGRLARLRAAQIASAGGEPGAGDPAPVFAPPEAALIDAPFAAGPQDWQILTAVRAEPWSGAMRVFAGASNEQLRLIDRVEAPAAMGVLLEELPAGRFAIWQEDARLRLSLRGASLQSAAKRQVLNGANLLAVESPAGGWEFLQFRDAMLAGEQEWILSGLLRGQFGTDDQALAPIPAGARAVLIDQRIAQARTG